MGATVAPVASAAFVASQQVQQATLVSLLGTPLDNAWQLLDATDPTTLATFITAVDAVTHQFGRISGNEAAKYYEALRLQEGIRGVFRALPAPPADSAKVDASIRWATKDLWQPNADPSSIKSLVTNVTEKNVLDTGRQTILNATKNDRRAKGWARETEPGACAFCAMLASRGAVYHYNRGDFQAHNACRCFAVPVFNAFEATAQVREWQQLYRDSTTGVRGSKAMRNAFRQAYEAKYPTAS